MPKQIRIEINLKWAAIYIAVAATCLWIIFGDVRIGL